MRNQFTEFKTLLKILLLEDQISEISDKIIQVRNENVQIIYLIMLMILLKNLNV